LNRKHSLCALVFLGLSLPRVAPADPSPAQQQQAADLSHRASDLIDAGKLSEAESTLRQALALVPAQPTRLYNLACVLEGEGKSADAMTALEQATDAGFTDFTILSHNRTLAPLRNSLRYAALLARKDQIVHHAAGIALSALRRELGDKYLYDADEQHKLVFAVGVDRPALAMLKRDLLSIESAEESEIFSHPPDEFIRIVIPTEADFSRLAPSPHLGGEYDDTTRTAVSMRLGQFMTHEFTHALHAADQHALGQAHPVWLSEGLASLYESAEVDGGQLIPHDSSRLKYVRASAKNGTLPSLEQLLKMNREDFNARPDLTYGEASYLLRYLQENGQLRSFYDAYTAGYGADTTGAIAWTQVTRITLSALQKTFEKWIEDRPDPRSAARPGGPMLGVGTADAIDGVRITSVLAGGPAALADIMTGDVLVAMDGKEMRDRAAMEMLLAPHEADQLASIRLRRGKDYSDTLVTLGKHPDK
jgi:tetratricopeptide (TPR) repeat protein